MRHSLLFLIGLTGCATGEDPDRSRVDQEIASVMGGVEWSIDAPWRMEPPYGPIPITVTFHDGNGQKDPATQLPLARFCGASIGQYTGPEATDPSYLQNKAPSQFHEIESHGRWPNNSDIAPPAADRLKRLWNGDSLTAADLQIGATAEWNATVMFTPTAGAVAGNDVIIQVVAVVSDTGTCVTLPASMAPPSRFPGPRESVVDGIRYFRQLLKVHYGEAALPRFDAGWVYGDLHYHSQGTDNEGESGISYRAVIQSMKAMGLDFAFATEHASNSAQVTDTDDVFVDNLPDLVPDWLEDLILDRIREFGLPYETSIDALRDTSAARFAYLRDWLNNAAGVNGQVLSSPGLRAPQLFLGGEVDAIPEISDAEKAAGFFMYGNGKRYDWSAACTAVPSLFLDVVETYTSFEVCPDGSAGLVYPASEGGRWLVRDIQAVTSAFFARQHFVHLPYDPARADAFVASNTTRYGGAFRRLAEILEADYQSHYQAPGKGYLFLAHPVNAASGSGYARLGPDIVPYSDTQLLTAFQSRYVLGLQLWNEDARLRSADGWFPMITMGGLAWSPTSSPGLYWDLLRGWQEKHEDGQLSELHHGAATWDKMLLWGLDPAKKPAWVQPGLGGFSPRKVFMAGGSDGHGDLNFRREGAISGWSGSNDTAIGKPRNLVFVGASRPVAVTTGTKSATTIGQGQVVTALQSGNFSVTDGPALRIAIDANGNGEIDDGDVPMGGQYLASGTIPLLVEFKSTIEWGPVASIDLYIGAYAANLPAGVYAPEDHGARSPTGDPKGTANLDYTDAHGIKRTILHDHYLLDPTGKLRITVSPKPKMVGTIPIALTPSQYPVFDRQLSCVDVEVCDPPDEVQPHPVCWTEPSCTRITNVARTPERLYVRAFARSNGSEPGAGGTRLPVTRFAYTNPIWVKVAPPVVSQ